MKQNEPIRTGGVGKMQVAFATSKVKNALQAKNPDEISIVRQQGIEDKASAIGIARAISNSASTSLKQDVQNNCFEIGGIYSFFLSNGGIVNNAVTLSQGADLPFSSDRIIVNSPLFSYNTSDRYLYFNKSGWYMVRLFLFAPLVNAGHEWAVRLISNVTLNGVNYEAYNTFMDYNHQAKHPYVNGTTFVNIPATVETNNGARPGVKFRLYSSTNNINFSTATYASLQVIRLSDLEHSTRLILQQV